MASIKEYAYYVKGKYIAIVESYVDSNTSVSRSISRNAEYKSPQSTVENAMLIEYVAVPKTVDGIDITDETSDINISIYLSKALVYYVKARLAEDAGEFEMKEYFMREFKKIAEKYDNTRIAGPRIVSSGFHAIR